MMKIAGSGISGRRFLFYGISIALGLTAAVWAGEAAVLVREGEAQGAIVLHADAGESERWAAEELQTHLREMSGAELPIREGGEGVVYLGRAAVEAGLIDGIDGLGTDGFAIRTRGAAVGIAGSPVRGTMYGVFTLLDELGCRWWTPTESTIPQRDTVRVEPTDRSEVPPLEYRDMMYYEMWGRDGQIWAARNRINGQAWQNVPDRFGGRYHFVGNLVHSYNQLMRESGMELKDEMWALVDGVRRPNSQPCLTHPDTLEAMTISVLQRFEDNPGTEFVVVGQNDNHNYCRCENCAAVAEREGSQSGHVIEFANRLLERVREKLPDARITTPAYEWSRRPPEHVRPHEDIIIVLCSIECDFNRPIAEGTTEENRAFREDIEGWSEIADTLFIWDYTAGFHHFLMPHPNLDAFVPNIRFMVENGAGGYFAQGAHTAGGSEFYGLRMWVLARTLWSPKEADGDALIEEFLEGYYGPAAGVIGEYIDIIHGPPRAGPDMRMPIGNRMNRPYVAPELIAEAEEVLRRAAAAVQSEPEFESRVRHARMPVWYVLAKRRPESRTWRTVQQRVEDMSFGEVAAELERVSGERNVTRVGGGFDAAPWLAWLRDYADRIAGDGTPQPEELEEAEVSFGRIIQAGHMDYHHARGEWFGRADGASDGWAIKNPTPGWYVRHFLDESEDFTPDQTYRLMARVRGEGVSEDADGTLAQMGGVGGPPLALDAALLKGGRWHVVEVAEWQPQHDEGLWIALTVQADREGKIEALQLDCFWLEPVVEGR